MRDIPHTKKLFIGGDFNVHFRVAFIDFVIKLGGFCFGVRNSHLWIFLKLSCW